jgi:hypothetical protein
LPCPSHDRYRSALRIIVALVLLGLITHGTYAGSGDEPHYLAIAHSVAFDFDLDVANNYGRNEPLIAGGELEAGPHVRQGRGGVARSVHDVGLPLLLAPVARIGVPLVQWIARTAPPQLLRRVRVTPTILYRHLLSVCMMALAIALAGMLFDTFLALGGSPRASFATTLLVALSPPLMIYSVLTFTELLSAWLCFFAFRRIALDRRDVRLARLESAVGRGPAYWFATGAAIGFMLIVHVRNAGLVAALSGLGLAAIRRSRSWRDLAGFGGGLAVTIGVRTLITFWFWGTLLTTPHGRIGAWGGIGESTREAGVRLAGLFFDQEYGLLIYAPVYVLALLGLAAAPRVVVARILIIAGCYLALVICPVTNVHGWTGEWCPAARMMVPIVPLLAAALMAGARALPRPIVGTVVVIQLAISAYLWQNPKNLWNDGDGVAAICARGSLGVCAVLPSFTALKPNPHWSR